MEGLVKTQMVGAVPPKSKPNHCLCLLKLGLTTNVKSLRLGLRMNCQHQQRPLGSSSGSGSGSGSMHMYSSRISTDVPFYESASPGASFDDYLEDKPRVFQAIFPDKKRSQQLNQDEWRIHMLPIQFFFLTVLPVVDMRLRCKSKGRDYPSGIPPAISKVLELDIVRWELQGLDNVVQPDEFSLCVQGALYSDRQGMRSRLKGQLEMKISLILPPVLYMIPYDVHQNVAESVLKRLVENMKDRVNGSLLADYSKYRRERLISSM